MNTTTTVESHALAVANEAPAQELAMQSPGNTALILDPKHLHNMMAVANIMATGTSTVPAHLQKKPGDCLAVVMQAAQWGMNPFAVAQKTHVVNGALGYEAQLVHAVLETTGAIDGRFHYEYTGEGNNLSCRVGAVCRGEGAITWGEWLNVSTVTTKNSPLWKTNPKQQMGYLQVKNWARAFKPGAILGVYTPEEIQEQPPKNMGNADVLEPEIPAALLTQAAEAAKAGVAAYQKFWAATGVANRKTLASRHDGFKEDATNADAQRTVDNAPPPAPAATYASVMDKMVKATNADALAVASDWIGEVADPEQRAELTAKYNELAAKFGGAA